MKTAPLVLALVLVSSAEAQAPASSKQKFAAAFVPVCQTQVEQEGKQPAEQARRICQCVADELIAKHDEAWFQEFEKDGPMSEAQGAEIDRATDMCMAK